MLTEAQLATLAYVGEKQEIVIYFPRRASTPLKRLVKLGLLEATGCGPGATSYKITLEGKVHLTAYAVQAHEAMHRRGW